VKEDHKKQELPDGFVELIGRVLDGVADEGEVAQLDDSICRIPGAVDEWLEAVRLEMHLESIHDPSQMACDSDIFSATRTPLTTSVREGNHHLLGRVGLWLVSVATVVLVLFSLSTWSRIRMDAPLDQPPMTTKGITNPNPLLASQGVAILTGQAQSVWKSEEILAGRVMPPGRYQLESGVVQIDLFSGVRLVVEGHADFVIESPLRVRLHRGAARAQVPKAAEGFRIDTAAAEITDLGTEFAVRVDGITTDFSVIEGAVEVQEKDGVLWRAEDGQSFRLQGQGGKRTILQEAVEVVSAGDVLKLESTQRQQRQRHWRESLQLRLDDNRLLACYKMLEGGGDSRALPNLVPASQSDGPAVIVGGELSRDRWGNADRAVDFTQFGSRLRVSVSGQHDGLTFICWAKINNLDHEYNSLFLTDGHDSGEPHWQILRDGRVFFSVKQSERVEGLPMELRSLSVPLWSEEIRGRWLMFAVTFDNATKQVHHYLNGVVVGQTTFPEKASIPGIEIGPASIGNWADPVYRTDDAFTSRNLNGVIDELWVYGAPLTASDIQSHYAVSNPYASVIEE